MDQTSSILHFMQSVTLIPNASAAWTAVFTISPNRPVAKTADINDGPHLQQIEFDFDPSHQSGLPLFDFCLRQLRLVTVSAPEVDGPTLSKAILRSDEPEPNVGSVCFGAERIPNL